MAVVDESVFALLIAGFWGLLLYSAYLRLFVVRGLRKRVDRLVEDRLASSAPAAELTPGRSPSELKQVTSRLEVLERIVTDGGLHTAAQIEALRHAPREPALQQAGDLR